MTHGIVYIKHSTGWAKTQPVPAHIATDFRDFMHGNGWNVFIEWQ